MIYIFNFASNIPVSKHVSNSVLLLFIIYFQNNTVIICPKEYNIIYYNYVVILGEINVTNTESKMNYRLVNSEEKNRIKNNDKSIAALEGKNMLYDSPATNNKYVGKMWKYRNNLSQYKRKIMLRQKFAKQLGMKTSVKPDKSLGEKGKKYMSFKILLYFYYRKNFPSQCCCNYEN